MKMLAKVAAFYVGEWTKWTFEIEDGEPEGDPFGNETCRKVLQAWLDETAKTMGAEPIPNEDEQGNDAAEWSLAFQVEDPDGGFTLARFVPYRGEEVTFAISWG